MSDFLQTVVGISVVVIALAAWRASVVLGNISDKLAGIFGLLNDLLHKLEEVSESLRFIRRRYRRLTNSQDEEIRAKEGNVDEDIEDLGEDETEELEEVLRKPGADA